MEYKRGNSVEVSSDDEGFVGSYYEATIVTKLKENEYIVSYKNLLKDDQSGPLREVVPSHQLRPTPPAIPVTSYYLDDRVDAYHNDGWWFGRITGRIGKHFTVFFDTSGDEATYTVDMLRFHLDWCNGRWISSQKRVFFRDQVDDDKGKKRKYGV